MKNVIAAVLLLAVMSIHPGAGEEVVHALRYPQSGGGTITPVGTPACANTTSGGSLTVTYTPYAAGDELFVSIAMAPITISPTVTGVQDLTSGGSTYTHGSASWPESGGSTSIDEWYTLSLVSGVTSVKATFSATAGVSMCVSEYSGGSGIGASPNQGTWTSSPGTSYSATLTMAASSSYGVCAIGMTTAVTPTATAGTIRKFNTNGTYATDAIQDNTGSTSLSVAGTLSPTAHNGEWTCLELHL